MRGGAIGLLLLAAAAFGGADREAELIARLERGGSWAVEAVAATRWLEPGARVRVLARGISAPDAATRYRCALELGSAGPAAAKAVPALIQGLYDADQTVRFAAMQTLGMLERAAAPAVSFLHELLFESGGQSAGARGALHRIGGDPPPLLEPLRRQLVRSGRLLEDAPRRALFDPGLRDALEAALRDDDWRVAGQAALQLGALGPPEPSTRAALLRAAAHPVPYVRFHALRALGTDTAPLLDDESPRVRHGALLALETGRSVDPRLAPTLARLLEDDWRDIRHAAARLLARLGPAGTAHAAAVEGAIAEGTIDPGAGLLALGGLAPERATGLALRLLRDADPQRRLAAVAALADTDRTEALVEACFDPDERVARHAVALLGNAKAAVVRFLPELVELARADAIPGKELNALIRDAGALAGIEPQEIEPDPDAPASLASPDARQRWRAVMHLQGRDPVLELLRTGDARLKQLALVALRRRDPPPADVLLAALADPALRTGAARLLRTRDAVEHLAAVLEAGTPGQAREIVAALGRIGGPRAAAVLSRTLRRWPDLGAATALGACGPDGAIAIPDLVSMARWDRDERARFVLPALAKMGAAGERAIAGLLVDRTFLLRAFALDLALREKLDGEELRACYVALTKDPAPRVAMRARAAVERFGIPVHVTDEEFLAALVSRRRKQEEVVERLRERFDAAGLTRLLGHGRTSLRAAAAVALGRLGEQAAPAQPRLIELLKGDRDVSVRLGAARALAGIGSDESIAAVVRFGLRSRPHRKLPEYVGPVLASLGERALPALTAGLRDKDRALRYQCVHVLERLGPAALPALPAILERIKQGELGGSWTASAIGAMGEAAVAPVLEALRYPDRTVRGELASALAKLGPPAVRALANVRDHPSADYRIAAVSALAACGTGANVTAALRRFLDDPESKVRRAALSGFHAKREGSLELLVTAAADPDSGIRRLAADRLDHFDGKQATAAIEALVRLLGDSSASVAREAKSSLRRYGAKARPAIEAAVRSPDLRLRSAAVGLLHLFGADSLPALRVAMRDEDALVRVSALEALRRLHDLAAPALPELSAALRDSEIKVREQAASAIGELGAAGRPAIPELVRMLVEENAPVHTAAADALARLEPPVEVFLELFDHEVEQVALRAAHAAGRCGPTAREPLVRLFEHGSARRREMALVALSAFGEHALPYVRRALNDDTESVRVRAYGLAASRFRAQLLPELRRGLRDPSPAVRKSCLDGLRLSGLAARDAADSILALFLKPVDQEERNAALAALRAIGMPPHRLPGLVTHRRADVRKLGLELARDAGSDGARALAERYAESGRESRRKLEQALVEIGAPAVPFVAGLLKCSDPAVRFDAAWMLGQLESAATGAVDSLIHALGDRNRSVRHTAAWALGRIGKGARKALPALEELVSDRDMTEIVADAIARIRGKAPQ